MHTVYIMMGPKPLSDREHPVSQSDALSGRLSEMAADNIGTAIQRPRLTLA